VLCPQEYYYIGYLSERSVAKRDTVFFGKVCPVITELALINEPYLLFFLTECEILLDIFNRQKHDGYSIEPFGSSDNQRYIKGKDLFLKQE
jgi:hypothetical protein